MIIYGLMMVLQMLTFKNAGTELLDKDRYNERTFYVSNLGIRI